jgi:hypothetical protein
MGHGWRRGRSPRLGFALSESPLRCAHLRKCLNTAASSTAPVDYQEKTWPNYRATAGVTRFGSARSIQGHAGVYRPREAGKFLTSQSTVILA